MRPPPDKYDDLEYLAQGGMARVYRARRKGTERLIALREIAGGPGSEQRLESEHRGAQVQQALCAVDPRVPQVYDVFFSSDGWLYIEMEYIEGEDLSDRLQRGPIPPADAVRIALEVFDFLRVAHGRAAVIDGEHRVQVHGDLTPRNVRLTPAGAVKILDFGIAKGLKATVTAQAYANCGYMSPERARTGRMGIADDYWSAGVLFYEMLAGARAFAGSEEEIRAALAARRGPVPLQPHIPRPLRLIAGRLLAWDVASRYPTADAALDEFRAFASGRRTLAEIEADEGRTRAISPGAYAGNDVTRAVSAPVSTLTAVTPPPAGTSPVPASTQPVAPPPLIPPPLPASALARPPLPAPAAARPVTAGGTPLAAAAKPAAVPPAARRKAERKAGPRIPLFRAALVIALALGGFHEVQLWDEVQARARTAATEPLDADRLWNDYQDLRGRAWSSQTTARLGRVVADRFTTAAVATLRSFRDDEPSATLRQYSDARELLTRALEVDSGRRTTQAWLEDAEGHIARIAGEDKRGEPRADRRRQKLQQAVSHFEEAARLDPRLPDPYLGLARIYTYGMRSPLLARQSLTAAEERGHTLGRREHAQLGDLLDADGRDLYRQARQARGSSDEEAALLRAREQLQTALYEYSQGDGFGDAAVNARRVQDVLALIDARVAAIHVDVAPTPEAVPSPDDAEQSEADADSDTAADSERGLQSL